MQTLAIIALVACFPDDGTLGLSAYPGKLDIQGSDDARQFVISLGNADMTGVAKYEVTGKDVIRVETGGRVIPIANGTAEIIASFQGQSVKIPVTVSHMDSPKPINFTNQVSPILTKLGCNAGGCHGKIQGQNGFRLSLLGFDPELDYMTLVKESRGRRLLPASPDASLFLLKASGQMPHGGGRKMDPAGEEYKVVRRWIASGMPFGDANDPKVEKLSVFPDSRSIGTDNRQQLVVHAHYSDGSTEDVTRRAQFESNETEIANVNEKGLVQTQKHTGQAAVMIRFSGKVTVFRAIVPRPGKTPGFDFAAKTVVDEPIAAKWKELGITPSIACTDEQFIRRVSLDITGTLPGVAEVVAFTTDKDPAKRDKLVDKLVESPEYGYYFANKWADILRVKRRGQTSRMAGTFAFHSWIRETLANDVPYDQFVREIVTAVGEEATSPPTVWYKEVTTPEQFVDDISQVFLGQRLACANCHHHPYERWTQDDYWGLAAYFARVGSKPLPNPGSSINADGGRSRRQSIYIKSSGSVTNKRTSKPAVMQPLDGQPLKVSTEDDPRKLLADWMTSDINPFFAKAIVNRYWAHFFGRGIVDPLDDMRATNPPSNPALLDALAVEFVRNKYSLKALVKVIAKSRVYSLSSLPNEFNRGDRQNYARYHPKRLSAEVLFDAVAKATGSPSTFNGLPTDRNAPQRAIMLPDESFPSYFLDVTGRPQRISACECERVNEASLAMTLHLLNSQEVQDKIGRGGSRVDQYGRDKRSDEEKVKELFLATLCTSPTPEQLKAALEHLTKHSKEKKQAYENILWALLNSKSFVFNQ